MTAALRIAVVFLWVLCAALLFAGGQGSAVKTGDLWLGGNTNAPVKIELFSDFQCPVCRAFYLDTIKPLLASFTEEKRIDKIYVVYHDFPLDMHPYARKAACYALAAEQVNREAWLRVTDRLYLEQEQWSKDGNVEAAISKVLDPTELARVRKLSSDPSIEQKLRSEILLGQSRQITSTPTFFVITQSGHQERVSYPVAYLILKGRIESLLK